MPFLRFSRDKRGYEHYYLVQPTTRRGKTRPRLLYWFRTPPNVKIGREPFDAELRLALERQNPDVRFDWRAIVETPIPPVVDTERWRERRRQERAMRQDAAAELQDERPADGEPPHAEAAAAPAEPALAVLSGPDTVASLGAAVPVEDNDQTTNAAPASNGASLAPETAERPRRGRRRRRRGRRGDSPAPGGAPSAEDSSDAGVESSVEAGPVGDEEDGAGSED
ncbi:MAG: hypothetical protein ABUS56_13210 [Acidobacteriota bacterium]